MEGQTSVPPPSASKATSSAQRSPAKTEHNVELLGCGAKEVVQEVQSLCRTSKNGSVTSFPKIVAVGDRNTGKSSLIEAISKIPLPRGAKTCTRCPLAINLTKTSEQHWNCEVFLQKRYIYRRDLGSSHSRGKRSYQPFDPWVEHGHEDLHFASLTDPAHVVDALERAQLAILNPSSSYDEYKPGNPLLHRGHQAPFSPNVIRLDVCGPGLSNLSFYDLPGVITSTEDPEEADLIPLIRSLVREYVQDDSCINLLALAMTHDVGKSSALGLVKEVKAEARTVGCLTKPDIRDPREVLDPWIRLLHGDEDQLGFGYYVVKNSPSPTANYVTARNEEAAFFQENEPWTTALNVYRHRFGISQFLSNMIGKLQRQVHSITATLDEGPETLDRHGLAIVSSDLLKLAREIHQKIDEGFHKNTFCNRWRRLGLELQEALANSRPVLKMSTPPASVQRHGDPSCAKRIETPAPGPSPSRGNIPVVCPGFDAEVDLPPSSVERSGKKRSRPSNHSASSECIRIMSEPTRGYNTTSKRFGLAEVRDILRNAYTGLPNLIDPVALERMIRLSQDHWPEAAQQFISHSQHLCRNLVLEQVHQVFEHHQQSKYYQPILAICNTFFEEALASQRQAIQNIVCWELTKPHMLDVKAFDRAQGIALTLLQTRRRELRAYEAESGRATSGPARVRKVAKLIDTGKLDSDPYFLEVKAMSVVKGYYEIAHQRFVDYLWSSTYYHVVSQCAARIDDKIRSAAGV